LILDETVRLNDIVCNLQSFARPAKPLVRPCALAEVSANAVGLLSDQARKKGVTLEIQDRVSGVVCMADPAQLTQVLLNLVLNAIDACEGGNRVAIVLDAATVDQIIKESAATPGYRLAIDLEQQTITMPGRQEIRFEIDPFRKHCLLNGLDEIGLSLQHADKIRAFEAKHRSAQPWLFG